MNYDSFIPPVMRLKTGLIHSCLQKNPKCERFSLNFLKLKNKATNVDITKSLFNNQN